MTDILIPVLAVLALYGLYIASLNARIVRSPLEFLDAGATLAPWVYLFVGAGAMIAGIGLQDHLTLTSRFGLQYNHTALGLIVAALASVVVQKRFREASRLVGATSPGTILGLYFNSISIRLFVLLIACLFGLPFAASRLSELADLVSSMTDGGVIRAAVIWGLGFALFLTSVIGGWRGTALAIAALSLLLITGLAFVGGFSGATLGKLAFLSHGIATDKTLLADQIPGVLKYSSGIGKEAVEGGIWTALSILSFSLSLAGLVLSPAMLFLGNTTNTEKGFAFKQVWMVAGIAAGLLLLLTPFFAAEIAAEGRNYEGLVARFLDIDVALGICAVVLVVVAGQIVVAFFATSAALLVTMDVVHPYIVPDPSPSGRRYSARIVLALIYLVIVLMATYFPLSATVLASVATSLSIQLLPALLGICWIAWISRGAVICGLIVGSILTIFTEPLGLVLFEFPFVDLPWGRWPLTIHSAAWGLVFNFSAVLLVSISTRQNEERGQRDRLHRGFDVQSAGPTARPAARTAKWSLALIWAFFAVGPGAVLGNTFFSQAIFTTGETALGIPSLWAWQICFWFLGVLLVWWIAYGGATATQANAIQTLEFDEHASFGIGKRVPNWIGQSLARIAGERPVK